MRMGEAIGDDTGFHPLGGRTLLDAMTTPARLAAQMRPKCASCELIHPAPLPHVTKNSWIENSHLREIGTGVGPTAARRPTRRDAPPA